MPLSRAQTELAKMPQAYFTTEELRLLGRGEDGKAGRKKGIAIEEAIRLLDPLDMEPHYSFEITAEECHDPSLRGQLDLRGKVLATAQSGLVAPRRRTHAAMVAASAFYSQMEPWGEVSKETVAARCKNVIYCQAGTQSTLGRLAAYYPKKNRVKRDLVRVSVEEAQESITRCGLRMDARYQPLHFRGDGPMVSVNADSENGFPFMGKWSDEMTHAPILEKAAEIEKSLEDAYAKNPQEGVGKWLRAMEASPETLKYVCLRGKCKADPYKKEKLTGKMMRFYNVFPRQILLNLMRVTQVMDSASDHISAKDIRMKSAIGLSLVREGALELVSALEKSVADDGVGYVHVGDDSWVVFEDDGKYCMFSVDCSSFDLTQESSVTEEVHVAIRKELEKIHAPTAKLWYAYARERCVVTVNSQVYRWKHAGPSGFPLQSKVNDVLMDVYLRRVIGRITGEVIRGGSVSRNVVAKAMGDVGKEMGLVARLEDYYECQADSLKEALAVTPFKFIGFYFYVEDGKVYVVADMERQLSQIQYPSSFWVETEELKHMEAVRLAGVFISLGRPPMPWVKAFEAFRGVVAKQLKELVGNDHGIKWLPENAFVGVSGDDVKSIVGLLGAVLRDWEILWGYEGELIADTFLLGREVLVAENLTKPVKGLIPVRPPTHPVTFRNLGRPPPTVRWAPDKPPRLYTTTVEKISGFLRQAGTLPFDQRTEYTMESDRENPLYEEEEDDFDAELYRGRRATRSEFGEGSDYDDYLGDSYAEEE